MSRYWLFRQTKFTNWYVILMALLYADEMTGDWRDNTFSGLTGALILWTFGTFLYAVASRRRDDSKA